MSETSIINRLKYAIENSNLSYMELEKKLVLQSHLFRGMQVGKLEKFL